MLKYIILSLLLLSRLGWASDCIVQSVRAPVTHGAVAAPNSQWDSYSNYLALAYSFDPLATNSSGKIVDDAPTGSATGTLTGAVWSTPDAPRQGHAYEFDGTDDDIKVIRSILPANVVTAIVVTAWIYGDAKEDLTCILCSRNNSSPYTTQVLIETSGTSGAIYAGVGAAYTYTSANAFTTTNWTMIGITYNIADGYVRTWRNGVQSWSSVTQSLNQKPTDATYKIGIGSANGALGRFFDGQIDCVRIYTNIAVPEVSGTCTMLSNIWYNTKDGLYEKGW